MQRGFAIIVWLILTMAPGSYGFRIVSSRFVRVLVAPFAIPHTTHPAGVSGAFSVNCDAELITYLLAVLPCHLAQYATKKRYAMQCVGCMIMGKGIVFSM